ncbi:unnamed protein product [Caenorhabditis auriculariae]|uniref:Paired domain-containing protein n=1 Tax=Caenorhabditis auriculariae TaxID=2777116 RepID=A0A8S1GUS0_9PELO|nr:unnamed protein product [Caenorhabditis auriculariae]
MVAPSPYRTAIIDCVKSGMTNSEIVKKLKVSRVLVFRTAQRYRRLGTSDDIQRRGRPVTVTTPEAVKAANKNGQNHRIIATDYQSTCEKGNLNKTSHPASVMVFAGITADGKTPLIFVDPGVKTALIKKWDEIDDDYLRAVIDAYPKRLKAVITAKGGRFENYP